MKMKSALHLLVILGAFSTEKQNNKAACVQMKEDNSQKIQKLEQIRKQSANTEKILRTLPLHLVEAYSEPRNSIKMKMIAKQWMKLEITGSLNLLPNDSSIKILLEMETNVISWQDPYNLILNQDKEKITSYLQQNEEDMSNALFDHFYNWQRNIWYLCRSKTSWDSADLKPFVKEILFAMSRNVALDRRGNHCYSLRETPLMLCTRFDAEKAVRKLVERSADVNAYIHEKDRFTVLHYAGSYGSESLVAFLLQNGASASVNVQNEFGFTPLMQAAMSNNVEVVQLFLNSGADTKIKTAKRFGNKSVKDLENISLQIKDIIRAHEAKNFTNTSKCSNCIIL